MRRRRLPFRLTATVAIAGLLIAQVWPRSVLAQGFQPQQPDLQEQQGGDPPTRVGRLARVSGTVSFRAQDDTQWSPATLNYPVTTGYSFWTEPNAQAEIEVSASRVAMAPSTELDVTTLTDTAFQVTELQGELYLHLRTAAPDETYAVQTPRGVVTLATPGRYAVVAGDAQHPTTVTVVEGTAQVSGPDLRLDVGPNQTASMTGSDVFQGDVGPVQNDAFLTAMLDRDRPPAQAVAPPQVVAAMPGGEDLAQYGTWADTPEYGQVWYPQVAPNWAPYRDGNWAYVAPWGWTWVDSAPWGFAPFHYGRWYQFGGRWGWLPGRHGRPAYAPALVTFLGVGAAAGIGIGGALGGRHIGWLPLGPREPFRPWYRASARYFRQVNITHVNNFNALNRNVALDGFANHRAVTVVPTSAMTASRPVASAFQRVDPAQLGQARPVFGQQPLRPAATTAGVTPAVARQLNLAPTSPGLRPAAPGPTPQAAPLAASPGLGSGAAARPGMPQPHNPSQGLVPAAGAGLRPLTGTPPLTAPGNRPAGAPPNAALGSAFGLRPAAPVAASPGAVPGPAFGPRAGAQAPAAPAPGAPAGLRSPGAPGQPPNQVQRSTVAPGAVSHVPAFGPGSRAQTSPPPMPPMPQVHTPSAGAIRPAAPFHVPPPPAAPRAPSPPTMMHAAPPPQLQPPPPAFHQASPLPTARPAPPQVQAPAPSAFRAPPPAPHAAAPQQSQFHKRPGEP